MGNLLPNDPRGRAAALGALAVGCAIVAATPVPRTGGGPVSAATTGPVVSEPAPADPAGPAGLGAATLRLAHPPVAPKARTAIHSRGRALPGHTGTAKRVLPAPNRAIAFARAQLGTPYVWGGNGRADGGFDCSGLTRAAYASAGVVLPRTAHSQYRATTRVSESGLRPGDLVFYGDPNTKIHHVGLYIGGGKMIDAPRRGRPVGIHSIRYPGDDFAGGGRV